MTLSIYHVIFLFPRCYKLSKSPELIDYISTIFTTNFALLNKDNEKLINENFTDIEKEKIQKKFNKLKKNIKALLSPLANKIQTYYNKDQKIKKGLCIILSNSRCIKELKEFFPKIEEKNYINFCDHAYNSMSFDSKEIRGWVLILDYKWYRITNSLFKFEKMIKKCVSHDKNNELENLCVKYQQNVQKFIIDTCSGVKNIPQIE